MVKESQVCDWDNKGKAAALSPLPCKQKEQKSIYFPNILGHLFLLCLSR